MSFGFPPDIPDYANAYEPYRNPRISGRVRRVLRAVVTTLMPRNDVFSFERDLTDEILAAVERILAFLPPLLAFLLPLGVRLVDWYAVVAGGQRRRFHRMDAQARAAYMERLVHVRFYPVRELIKGLKALVLLAFYDHPEVGAKIGYDHAAHARAMIAKRKDVYGLDVA